MFTIFKIITACTGVADLGDQLLQQWGLFENLQVRHSWKFHHGTNIRIYWYQKNVPKKNNLNNRVCLKIFRCWNILSSGSNLVEIFRWNIWNIWWNIFLLAPFWWKYFGASYSFLKKVEPRLSRQCRILLEQGHCHQVFNPTLWHLLQNKKNGGRINISTFPNVLTWDTGTWGR